MIVGSLYKNIQRTLLGFSGLGGLAWLGSVLASKQRGIDEDLEPEDIAEEGTAYLDVDGHRVAYQEMGSENSTVVFLHGFGGRMQTWQHAQRRLAGHHRTIALDLWGFGASARPATLAPRDWIRQVFGVMDALDIPDAAFVTHSLGSRVSLMCAREAPERVRALTLCNGDAGHMPHGYLMAWLIAHTPFLCTLMKKLRAEPWHVGRLMQIVSGRGARISDSHLQLYHAPLRVIGTAQALSSIARAHPFADLHDLTENIACPTLLIWGEDDPVLPVHGALALAAKMRAKLTVLPGCGHLANEEYEEIVTEHIKRFMDSIPSRVGET